MANEVNKYSKTGGLNPIWVEKDIQRRNNKDDKYIDKIASSITQNINNINKNNSDYKYRKNPKLKLDDELEVKLNFLKRHCDGTETDYQMAKYVIACSNKI